MKQRHPISTIPLSLLFGAAIVTITTVILTLTVSQKSQIPSRAKTTISQPNPALQPSRLQNHVGIGMYLSGFINFAVEVKYKDVTNHDSQVALIRADVAKQKQAFDEAGAIWSREDFPWNTIEKSPGEYDWWVKDLAMSFYDPTKNHVQGILQTTAPWASSAPAGTPAEDVAKYPPRNIEDWKNYVRQVVTRYQDKVRYWEILSEAEISGHNFIPTPGETFAQSYFPLIKAAYETIKEVDPNLQVVVNGFGSWNVSGPPGNQCVAPCLADQTLEYLMNNGGPYFDIFNIHIYSKQDPAIDVGNARTLLNRYGLSPIPIWVTETNVNEYLRANLTDIIDENARNSVINANAYLTWWINQQIDSGADKVFWFTLLNWPSDDERDRLFTAGLLKVNDFSRQPTWYTFQDLLTDQVSPTPLPTITPTTIPFPSPTVANSPTPVRRIPRITPKVTKTCQPRELKFIDNEYRCP